MKLVSPKNLLVSLLGCAFVVLKIVTFDGGRGSVLDPVHWIPVRQVSGRGIVPGSL